ncbi:MAG: alpha/beta fold hydrolase [Acidobacteria bacterium]|nr:alpha/beta fold hydrolase [Acidobacteriota bacterium]
MAAGSAAGVYIAAEMDLARERAARDYLGDLLYTEVRGSGSPVVFIAGLQGSTRYWGQSFDSLAGEHRLIFVDALGFGRSPWPAGIDYSLDDHIEALRRTLIANDATRQLTLVAHSFGTILAANYAARFLGEVSRVVLMGTPVFADGEQARRGIRRLTKLGALLMFNDTLARISCTAMCAFRPLLRRLLPSLRPHLDAGVVSDSVLHHLPAVDGAVNRILLRVPVQEALQEIGGRAVLIHGRADAVTPVEDARRVAEQTGAQLIEVPGDHQSYFREGIEPVHAAMHAAGSDGTPAAQ